jgi:hypothetical protein
MARTSPRNFEQTVHRRLNAWEQLRPAKSYGGMTLSQFQTVAAASFNARAHIEDLESQLVEALTARDLADEVTGTKMQLVVNGVLADPEEGPDGALYEAMGYRRKSDRRSGLTRKKKSGGDEKK